MLDLEPVSADEFFSVVGPCIALTGGVGMSREDQDAWLEAAFIALAGMPIRLLETGAKAAMETADHPSKIIPAIVKATKDDWEWRRNYRPVTAAPPPDPAAIERATMLHRIANRELTQGEIDALSQQTKLAAHNRYLLSTDYQGAWFYPGTRKVND